MQLLERVQEVPGIARIRFTSPHPKGYGDDLVEAYGRLGKLAESESSRVVPSVLTGFTDSHYFRDKGIASYGFVPFALTEDESRREHGINERYNALTGRAIGDPGVAMTCSAWPLLVQSVYGVQNDFRTIVVPPGAKGRRRARLPLGHGAGCTALAKPRR